MALRISYIIALIMVGCYSHLNATHNRAGEITYIQLDETTIEATITTYTKTSSFSVDRDSLELDWGDGIISFISRTEEMELDNDIKLNRYTAIHQYPSRGTYTMSVVDPNRIAGILNIDFPNSVDIQFYIETTFTLLDPRFEGPNSSVVLLQPPIDLACPNQPFTYNPNAFDPDGDSIGFELITPFQMVGVEVPNYSLPDEINPGPENQIFLDPITGDFLWESPSVLGEFNITYRINEYRNGQLINSLVRDMQILVRPCSDMNSPPVIQVIEEYCVIAGEMLDIPFEAYDTDSGDIVTVTLLGGPFEIETSPAVFNISSSVLDTSVLGSITWQTTCDHIAEEYYKIVIRATDIRSKPMTALATLRTILIKVVGPPPVLTEVIKENESVFISWEAPYICESTDLFQGFSVWRKDGSDNLTIDTCNGGLEGSGYEKIVFLTNELENGSYIAQDAELEPGKIYCYRVLAEFAQLTEAGNLYNRTASLPSEAFCIRSTGEEPIITNVSVLSTDASIGSIEVKWLLPDKSQIDTTELIGPYAQSIIEGQGFTELGSNSLPLESTGQISELMDTFYLSNNLNTVTGPFNYSIVFSSGELDFSSDQASSVYLETDESDESVFLNWQEAVPWSNFNYCIYQINNNGLRILLDSTSEQDYKVENLINGTEYCFQVESKGKYGLKEVNEPILNYSNTSCASPRDNVAPCNPAFTISTVCDDPNNIINEALVNIVTWQLCNDDDIAGYRIYFSSDTQSVRSLIQEVDASTIQFDHLLDENIAGCYFVTSFDQGGNESEPIQEICVDNCPTYVLPNAFTPNADQANDEFVPRVNQFIDRVVFEVYNRWGQKVWETTDPEINWDGTNFKEKELSEGTYYYTCSVFEKRVSGIVENTDVLRGTIQLMR